MYRKYELSGAVPVPGAAILMSLLPVATTLMAVVYAFAQKDCFLVYFCVLVAAGYAYATGWLAAWLARLGHVRNPVFVGTATFCSAVIGWYIVWGTHLYLHGTPDGTMLSAYRPAAIWKWMQFGFDHGFWGLGPLDRPTPNIAGWEVVAFWLGEFGLMTIFPTVLAVRKFREFVYCEQCGRWLSYKKLDRRLPIDPTGQLHVDLIQGNWSRLYVPVSAPEKHPHVRISVADCQQCHQLTVLKVEAVHFIDRLSRTDEKRTTIVEHALIDAAVAHMLNTGAETKSGAALSSEVDQVQT